MQLSIERAQSVADYLSGEGIPSSRMTVRGYGETQPIASNDTDAGKAKNRRVEFVLKEDP
jgi:OOP family OmpA-OmpF porin